MIGMMVKQATTALSKKITPSGLAGAIGRRNKSSGEPYEAVLESVQQPAPKKKFNLAPVGVLMLAATVTGFVAICPTILKPDYTPDEE